MLSAPTCCHSCEDFIHKTWSHKHSRENSLFLPIIITGSCFGLVHLPDVWTASVTVASGMAWSFIYYP